MSHLHLSRRGLLSVLALGASGAWTGWQWIEASDADALSLQMLAKKVLSKVPPEMTQACMVRISAQLNGCVSESVITLMAPVLHADDQAHMRTITVEGVQFSHTQIGLLALMSQVRAS
ncbi:MAG: hypothetical protein ACK4F8_10915 [Aquabacterium sp.]